MRLFPTATPVASSVDSGPAIVLKQPSRWRKLFRHTSKRRRSPSLSSAVSDSSLPSHPLLGELSTTSSIEDIRVIGHVQEIFLRDGAPEMVTSTGGSLSREGSVEEMVMKRDFLSEKTIFVDAMEDGEEVMGRTETMKSVYVDALSGEEREEDKVVEVRETMEVTVVAQVQDGGTLSFYASLTVDLPTICEDETEGYFTGIEKDEFVPSSPTAQKFLLLTFIILLTAKSKPVRIDSRWYVVLLGLFD